MTRFDIFAAVVRMASLCCAGLAGGCANYHARPLDPGASARALQARSLSDPQLLRFVSRDLHRPPLTLRWDLTALTAAAVFERPDIEIAAGEVAAARAGERTAAEWPNPVLGLAPTYDSTLVTPSPWKVGPVITDLLETAGKRPAAIAEAREHTEAARQQVAIAAWQLRGQVRTALIGYWSARHRLTLARRYEAAARELTGLVATRFKAGMVSAATLAAEQLTETRATLSLAEAERDERLADAALAAAVGVPERAIRGARIDLAGLDRVEPPHDLRALREAALTHRPEVIAALARYNAAQAVLRLAIAGQYPNLDIGPGYEYDQGENKFILSISLPLPVFNQNQGPIAAAQAARHVAAARFQQVQTAVLGQIETAVTDWQASRAEALRTRRLLQLAAEAVRRDRIAFKAGEIGRLQLAAAKLGQVQTELGALTAQVDERTALGQLEDAFHRPFIDGKRA